MAGALILLATAAATCSCAGAAAPLLGAADLGLAYETLSSWIADGYRRAPALMLGLAALILLPVLAFARLLIGWPRPDSERTHLAGHTSMAEAKRDGTPPETVGEAAWPAAAWIEIADSNVTHGIGRGMIRLGRDEDNDIYLPDKTVHRYHALIHWTEDAEFKITDLSSSEGNGVVVNGQRIAEARLRNGDTVELGQTVLTFHERPA